jgi:hypothetical protein
MTHPKVPHPKQYMKPPSFHDKLAVQLGKILGSMWFFYFCVLLDLAELPAVIQSHSAIAWVTYISQTVIQLLALPILQVYQNLLQSINDAKADADHAALTHMMGELNSIQDHLGIPHD